MNMAKASVRKFNNGVVVNSPDGIVSFIGMPSSGSMCIDVDANNVHSLFYTNTTGRILIGTGSLEEMQSIRDAVGNAVPSDHHVAIAMAYGLIGLMVGIGISWFAMFSSGMEHHPIPVLVNTVSAAQSATPAPVPTGTSGRPPAATAQAPEAGSVEAMIGKIAETDPARAQIIIKALNVIAEFVKRSEPVPEELIEQLPPDILSKLVNDATSLGFSLPVIRPKAPVPVPPVTGTSPSPTVGTQTPAPSVSRPTSSPPASAPVTAPASGSPLTWGDTTAGQRDRNGIPVIPEKNSKVGQSGAIELPGIGGGTLSTPDDLRSFGLPPQ